MAARASLMPVLTDQMLRIAAASAPTLASGIAFFCTATAVVSNAFFVTRTVGSMYPTLATR